MPGPPLCYLQGIARGTSGTTGGGGRKPLRPPAASPPDRKEAEAYSLTEAGTQVLIRSHPTTVLVAAALEA